MKALVTLLALGSMASACTDQYVDPRLSAPPSATVTTARDGDADGDGRVDITVVWPDSERVDAASTSVKLIGAHRQRNLLPGWSVTYSDTSMVIREPLEQMLPPGMHRLLIQVVNERGNFSTDTLEIDLAPGKLIKTMVPGRDGAISRSYDIEICDGVGYMPAGPYMVIFDPDSLEIIADVKNPDGLLDLKHLVCASTGEIFVTEPLFAFDRSQRAWVGRVPNTFAADAIVESKRTPGLLYIGENQGAIARFDANTHRRLDRISSISTAPNDYTLAIAVLPGDEKLYFTRLLEGGIIIIDPQNGRSIGRIHVGGNAAYGSADDLVLSSDGLRLFAAVYDGRPRAVLSIDTRTDVIQQVISLDAYRPAGLGLSPTGKRLFVVTQDYDDIESKNVLIDLQSHEVIHEFPRPRNGRRYDTSVTFHPNGKLIFVVRNMEIDVYLNRE